MNVLLLELLAWIATRPRTYGETMDAWRTSCPRAPVWEDATSAGLVDIVPVDGTGMTNARVTLTQAGQKALERAATSAS